MRKLLSLIACVTAFAFIMPAFAQDEDTPKKGKKVKKEKKEKKDDAKKPGKKVKKAKDDE